MEYPILTPADLTYAATTRCKGCGAGLAYPPHLEPPPTEWVCSGYLTSAEERKGAGPKHDAYPFAFYSILSEDQVGRTGGATTRPDEPAGMRAERAQRDAAGRARALRRSAAAQRKEAAELDARAAELERVARGGA